MIKRQQKFMRTERGGFTLIELLMVITIIAMLGGMTIAVSKASIESARRAKTEMTIQKLDQVVSRMYEKYQYRKVDVSQYMQVTYNWYQSTGFYLNPWFNTNTSSPDCLPDFYRTQTINGVTKSQYDLVALKTRWRLHVLRDTIRMDMPCCLAEILYGPVAPTYSWKNGKLSSSIKTTKPQDSFVEVDNSRTRTALSALFYRSMAGKYFTYNADGPVALTNVDRTYVNPELLYLMVTNGDPEARSLFTDREIGDVNGNGLFEFLDGWGHPIYWMRWAPGLPNNDRQSCELIGYDDDGDGNYDRFEAAYPDPMNPMGERVEYWQCDNVTNYPAYMLVPIIFSMGGDGENGVNAGLYSETDFNDLITAKKSLGLACQYLLWWTLNPYAINTTTEFMLNPAGKALSDAKSNPAGDNIHSHTVVR